MTVNCQWSELLRVISHELGHGKEAEWEFPSQALLNQNRGCHDRSHAVETLVVKFVSPISHPGNQISTMTLEAPLSLPKLTKILTGPDKANGSCPYT